VTTRSSAGTWRERPPVWRPWPAKAAATDVVARATLAVGRASKCHPTSRTTARAVAVDFYLRVHAVKALRFAPPALRAAVGLDRAVREATFAIVDGPLIALDALDPRRYSRIHFDGCARRNSLRIARVRGQRESAISDPDSFSLPTHLWLAVRATLRRRIRRSIRIGAAISDRCTRPAAMIRQHPEVRRAFHCRQRHQRLR
jgi:hypothetical protein